jgi:hypothetical protein
MTNAPAPEFKTFFATKEEAITAAKNWIADDPCDFSYKLAPQADGRFAVSVVDFFDNSLIPL